MKSLACWFNGQNCNMSASVSVKKKRKPSRCIGAHARRACPGPSCDGVLPPQLPAHIAQRPWNQRVTTSTRRREVHGPAHHAGGRGGGPASHQKEMPQ